MAEKTSTKILNLVQAQSQTTDELSKRLVKLEDLTNLQDSKNQNIIYAVLIATFLLIASIVAQVSLSDKADRERTDNLLEKVQAVENKLVELKITLSVLRDNISLIKTKNPYLK
ncbi:hypothetical protein HZA75_06930 [Candidatus Roizmanbacteria bacterium]|nr:hypothetical protein [Candidatus Roizmanbacteria bacterium]